MIKSFKHKGLERHFVSGNRTGIQAAHTTRIRDRLAFLHAATKVDDMDKPGYRLHKLTGDRKDEWSIAVSRNWRIVFKFDRGDAYSVNYGDYH